MRVIVVGAGVIGLSCAVRLAEHGHDVAVLARDLPPETTSAVAAALWYPYRALPRDAVTRWSATTYTELTRLAGEEPGCGVAVRWGTELVRGPVDHALVARRRTPPRPAARRCPTAATAGGGCRCRSPTCRSTCRGWSPGSAALRVTITRVLAGHAAAPVAEVAVVNCYRPGRARSGRRRQRDTRCAARWCSSSRSASRSGLLEPPTRPTLTYVVPREKVVVVGGTAQRGRRTTRAPTPRRRGDPGPGPGAGAGAGAGDGRRSPGRAAPGPPDGAARGGARRRRHGRALLWARRRGRDAVLGLRRRRRGAGRRGGRARVDVLGARSRRAL